MLSICLIFDIFYPNYAYKLHAYKKQLVYVHTPFLDHKLQHLTFATTVLQGPGTWKMNTSVLTDDLYHDLINDLLQQMDAMHFHDKLMWWDVFLKIVFLKIGSLDFFDILHEVKGH